MLKDDTTKTAEPIRGGRGEHGGRQAKKGKRAKSVLRRDYTKQPRAGNPSARAIQTGGRSQGLQTGPSNPKEPGDSHRILTTRLQGSLDRIIVSLSPSAARRALEASGPVTTIAVVIEEFVREHPDTLLTDPDALNTTRLAAAKRGIIEEAGGLISTADAAEILSISQSAVRKRIERGNLLSIPSASGEHRLPRVQFLNGGVLEGLEEVLGAMHMEDPWMRTQLFLDPDVLGALREGKVEDAVAAVRTYLPRDEGREPSADGDAA